MKEVRYELMSTLAARSVLEGFKSRTNDMSDLEYEMYEICYDYWSKQEKGLVERASK